MIDHFFITSVWDCLNTQHRVMISNILKEALNNLFAGVSAAFLSPCDFIQKFQLQYLQHQLL